MTANLSFGTGISWWSLEFTDPAIATRYQAERASFRRVPRQVRIFFIIAIAANAGLILIDTLSAYVFVPSYTYELGDVLLLLTYVPIFTLEFVFYKCKRLTLFRGSLFTCFTYFIVFYGSLSRFADRLEYPLVSPA